jgi:hypothetical protein
MKTIVLGASPNPERYAYEAVTRLVAKGHEVIPIGIRHGKTAADLDILNGMPLIEHVHTITLYISPDVQHEYYDYILNVIKPKRIIFNKVITIGSKNHDDSSIAENPNLRARFGDANNGFEVVVGNNLIVCDHQYSLISVNNNALNLRNPHGKNDITNLSIDDLKLYFSNIFIA